MKAFTEFTATAYVSLPFSVAETLCQQIYTNVRPYEDRLPNLLEHRYKKPIFNNTFDSDNNFVSRNLYKYALLGELAAYLLGLKNERTVSSNTSDNHDNVRVGFC
jgi:hypothetical protein